MRTYHRIFVLIAGMLLCAVIAYADVPASLKAVHGHSVTASGKLTIFRIQVPGLNIGPDNDRLVAEVLVTLDSQPDNVYGISLKDGDASAAEMAATLREAYVRNIPVTLQTPLTPGRKNLRITWVQLGG